MNMNMNINQKPDQTFRTQCHPEANGRNPQEGEYKWDFKFTLEDGSTLMIELGKEAHDDFRGFVLREEMEDAMEDAMDDANQAAT